MGAVMMCHLSSPWLSLATKVLSLATKVRSIRSPSRAPEERDERDGFDPGYA
jgi:hypothetical protein